MNINREKALKFLKNEDFQSLFIDLLGWDLVSDFSIPEIELKESRYNFSAIAHKRGVYVFIYVGDGIAFPDYPTRRQLERKLAKYAHEHFIIFVDPGDRKQIWQWVKNEPGKPAACREHVFYRDTQSGTALLQKLEGIYFSIDEEEKLTVIDVAARTKAAFDVEKTTKKFFDRFQKEHDVFRDFIKGIPDEDDSKWYTSIMLNRLMFTYFIQKKSFLDGDVNYLPNRLKRVKEQQGSGKFYSFYRSFLRVLFQQGLDCKENARSPEVKELIGKIPYLNGGIFHAHELEDKYPHIDIKDEAFEKIFTFFDQYQWHLDERPLRKDDEINPDVLGYIFEKYINNKQMGAYYTKEDITGYISRNTVIPRLFDMVYQDCKVAFDGKDSLWELLSENPDRYIYPAIKHGISIDIHTNQALPKSLDLPDEIAVGVDATVPNLLERRKEWNKPAPADYALPTEIWREVVARRQHYDEIWLKLVNGEVRSINDLITYNLDICQFAQDVVGGCGGVELVKAFYKAITNITILDPTCGSGAFLFAALNILEPLYATCIERMRLFLAEMEYSDEKKHSDKYKFFRETVAEVDLHPSQQYFIFKSIILNNLFGVDIMDEAVEICKLRLFLKLVAQIDDAKDLEPLPDIDFNIRAGNTLVGFTNYKEVQRAITDGLDFDNAMGKIDEKADIADRAFARFRDMQRQQNMHSADFSGAKQDLRRRLKELEAELNA